MSCQFCFKGCTVLARLILFTGPSYLVRYCPLCERIQRTGDSVPDVKKEYQVKRNFIRSFKKKGGDKH